MVAAPRGRQAFAVETSAISCALDLLTLPSAACGHDDADATAGAALLNSTRKSDSSDAPVCLSFIPPGAAGTPAHRTASADPDPVRASRTLTPHLSRRQMGARAR